MIQVDNLTKLFRDKKRGEIRAVDNLTFTCAAGETTGLLGLNGAGKTTTLRLLATMLQPTTGTIVINGDNAATDGESVRRSIGFLTGSTGLYHRLTPREIVAYYGRLAGMTKDEIRQRTATIFAQLAIDEFADRRIDKLSTGMRQKTSIARTLIHDPPVIILDEPTVGLDVITSRAIIETIDAARKGGKCVVFSTHIMYEAAKICDRIIVLHEGRQLATGTLDELRQQTRQDDLDEIFVSLIEASGGQAA